MLIVDSKIIRTPIDTIINLLKQQLILNRIDKLDVIEKKGNDIRVTCPIHSDGHERTPSCDILTEDKNGVIAGTVHCFGCSYKASIVKFIADCLNISYKSATEWLINISDWDYLEATRDIEEIDICNNASNTKYVPCVSLDELKQYDYVHPYMFERKLTDDIIKRFDVGYDPKTDSLTFPVYVDGKCQIVCKRSVSKHRFEMPEMDEKPIYGLDYVTGTEVIVCESIINALTCYAYGKEAIALLGTGSDKQYKILNNLNIRNYILAFDGDNAGRSGAKRFIKNINTALITEMHLPENKDINDLSREEFDELYSAAF